MSFESMVGHVDILRVLPEIDSFEGLFDRSIVKILGGEQLRVASIDDLIKLKTAAGRPKDLDHIRHLQALKKVEGD